MIDVDGTARRFDEAWEKRKPIAPLSETEGLDSPVVAYEIQTAWNDFRGERVLGHKIGLTSRAMQEQMGVDTPDYGRLWGSRYFQATGGHAAVPAEIFIAPRLEGEIAFLIGDELGGAGPITPDDVLAATEAVAVSAEIIDSRITDWRIKLVDTIADNSSFGAFTLGPWDAALARSDLAGVRMAISHNGSPVVAAVGADALGGPARAVAWLAGTLRDLGVRLSPGDVVLSGSLGRSLPAVAGDRFEIEVEGQPPLEVVFE